MTNKTVAIRIMIAQLFIMAAAGGAGYVYAKHKYEPDAIKLKARVDSVTLALEASNKKVIDAKRFVDSVTKADSMILSLSKPRVDTLWKEIDTSSLVPLVLKVKLDSIQAEYKTQENSYNAIINAKDSLINDMTLAAQVKDSSIEMYAAENTALQIQVDKLNAKLASQSRVTKILGLIAAGGIAYVAIRR